MQRIDVSLQENDKTQPENRGRPKVLPIFLGILFIFAFAGGFINGYSLGSHSSHKNGDAASIYLNFPPAASAESAASQNGDDYEPVMQAVLSNNEYIVYDALVDSVIRVAPQSSFTMPSATTVSMERIIEITKIVQNNPEFFWVEAMTWITWTDNADTTRTYTVNISYNMDAQTKSLTQKQIEAVVAPILVSASCRNASEAAAYVNEYLASQVTYMDDEAHQTEYPYDAISGPLLTQQAICSGYAKTFSYLMARLGYSSAYCLGYTKEGVFHAWNAIKDGDKILYTDPTFNASGSFRNDNWLNLPRESFTDHQETKKFWYEPIA